MIEKQGKRLTTDEFLARLYADPERQARKKAFDAAIEAEQERLAVAEAPIIAELNKVGVRVTSVWDLVNSTERYTAALPILLRHLKEDYPEKVRESIARAMAVPESRFAWNTLLSLFRREFGGKPNGVKWALAVALAAAADEEVMADLVEAFRDRRHGANRAAFVETLSRSRSSAARAVLEEGRNDADVRHEISRVLDRPKRAVKRSGRKGR